MKRIASDTITNEICLPDLVEFLSLKQPASEWAEKALHYTDGYERKNTFNEINKAGYDIKTSAKVLEQFYLSQ